jgi:transposase-like protein
MTHQEDYTFTHELAEKGLEAVPELLRVLINTTMQARETKDLQAEQYERTEEHNRPAAGYKPKTVRTSLGDFSFAIPQVRVGGFIHPLLKKGYALSDL